MIDNALARNTLFAIFFLMSMVFIYAVLLTLYGAWEKFTLKRLRRRMKMIDLTTHYERTRPDISPTKKDRSMRTVQRAKKYTKPSSRTRKGVFSPKHSRTLL